MNALFRIAQGASIMDASGMTAMLPLHCRGTCDIAIENVGMDSILWVRITSKGSLFIWVLSSL